MSSDRSISVGSNDSSGNSSSRHCGSLPELEKLASRLAAEQPGLESRFVELSRAGDRTAMVGLLLEAVGMACPEALEPGPERFRGKDELGATELLEQDREEVYERSEPGLLSEALKLAPPGTELFFEILERRARAWYAAGEVRRCLLDCEFCAQLEPEVAESEFIREVGIAMTLARADCYKALGRAIETRNWLNEAMRRIAELAQARIPLLPNQFGFGDAFRFEKARILNDFLQRKQPMLEQPKHVDYPRDREEEKKIPELDGKADTYLTSCSDAVALSYDESKGRMLYATRHIKAGSVIIVDPPFSFSTDITALHRNCLYCHVSLRLDTTIKVPCESCQTVQFCSRNCQQQAWNKFHKYECRIFDHFLDNKVQRTNALLAYRTVVMAAFKVQDNELIINREFLQLHDDDKNIIDIKTLKKYEPHDYKTVFSLETHGAQFDPSDNFERVIHSIFFAKCLIYSLNYFHPDDDYERHLQVLAVALLHNMHAINCNAYEIVENVRNDETKVLEPRNVGGAIYTSVSLTNHSCYPNIVRHSYPCGTVVVRAIQFIPQGSEILDCYGQHFLENKRDIRRKFLAKKYYFECQCAACTFDWPLTLPNDQFNFKCRKCFEPCRKTRNVAECTTCGLKTENSKLYTLLQNSIKKRLAALTKMYDGHYDEALPLLLDHANCVDKILSEPSLEAIKTQQSIIQCLNALSSTSV